MVYLNIRKDDPNFIQKTQINDIVKVCNDMDKICKKVDKNLQELEQIMIGYGNEPDEDLKPFFNTLLTINTQFKSIVADLKIYNYKNYMEYLQVDNDTENL